MCGLLQLWSDSIIRDWTNLSNLYHRIVPNWITFGNYLTLKSKPSKFFNLKYSISFRRFSMTSTLCQARRPRLPLAAGRERHGHRSGVVGDAQRGGWMVAAGVKSIGYWHGWEIQTIHRQNVKPIEYNGLGPRMVSLFFFLMSNSMVQARHPFQLEDPTLLGFWANHGPNNAWKRTSFPTNKWLLPSGKLT